MDSELEISSGIFLTKLNQTHDFNSFDCGDKDINEFLKEDAFDHIKKDLAIVYVIKTEQRKILAYATLSMSAIKLKKRKDVPYPRLPALLLGRLGTDINEKKDEFGNSNYYGYELINYCIKIADSLKEIVGCCYLHVESYPDMVKYYFDLGFETEDSYEEIDENIQRKEEGKKFRNIPMYFRLES